ncbi:MAG: NAD(P)H-dependent oxidoreductase [Spirochaetaceae bacterium]|jgi:multimeric flavodoxin WrbA|nr:NAD(P)H-dependent oxidoreductase [Spirochaetaceae bacterium]
MKYLIISGNPKKDGLCHSLTEEVKRGAKDGGADVEVLTLEKLERCHVCGDGWGTCLKEHKCAFGKDGFNEAQAKVQSAELFCFITPVYWAEMAEALKSFFDRLRRCENIMQPNGALAGKQVLLIASPGGSGNGMLTCLEQMDRVCRHTNALIFDYIGVNRWNSDYKKSAIYAAAKAMASGRKNGETV